MPVVCEIVLCWFDAIGLYINKRNERYYFCNILKIAYLQPFSVFNFALTATERLFGGLVSTVIFDIAILVSLLLLRGFILILIIPEYIFIFLWFF